MSSQLQHLHKRCLFVTSCKCWYPYQTYSPIAFGFWVSPWCEAADSPSKEFLPHITLSLHYSSVVCSILSLWGTELSDALKQPWSALRSLWSELLSAALPESVLQQPPSKQEPELGCALTSELSGSGFCSCQQLKPVQPRPWEQQLKGRWPANSVFCGTL